MELVFGSLMVTVIIGATTLLLLYWASTRNHDYWKKRGVPFVKPVPLFGSVFELFFKQIFDADIERHKKYGTIYGHYEGNRAVLSVADPTILRTILVKDFQFFNGPRVFISNDPIVDKMLFITRGEDWKRIRSIMTPTFSTGKIKRMLGIFKDCANTLVKNFKTAASKGETVDVKRLYNAFTMDIIASAAFSTKIDSHNDPDNQFVSAARKVFQRPLGWRFFLFLIAPWVFKIFKIKLFMPAAINFFREVTLQIIEERKKTGKVRNDFLQLLMDTAKEEVLEDTKQDATNNDADIASNYGETDAGYQIFKTTVSKDLSMDELVAQCVVFFLAGFDTTASTMSFANYFLALNPTVQDKLRQEVDQVITENGGKLTYEAIQGMKYMDNVISETLRLFPPAVRTERMCDGDYEVGNTGIKLKKGMIVTIPVYAMHRDPAHFPNPEQFDPDRFSPEERYKREQYAFLPFGAGPRGCVGMRFALIEMKVCLALVIANFKIKKAANTKIPPDFYISQQGLLQPRNIYLEMEIRKDCPITV